MLLLLLTFAEARSEVPETDLRNTRIRHTDAHYSLREYTSEEWVERAAFLRKQVLFAAGLLPLPRKGPLNPRMGETISGDGYSVSSVLLETYPGYFLGGNLYRPVGIDGPYPAIVSPHGHWRYGRFENSELNSVPARAINFARQGYVVFAYDMVGWNDTMQTPHGFAGPREELWLFGSLGLQLWNSIRVVDYLAAIPDVDAGRIGVTGASGGATQAFLLAAVDDRIGYAAPVNMVSFRMQGGSRCENAPLLRVGTNNVEIAALFAPKPQLLVSATGDWTANVPTEEFPALQRVYRLLGAGSEVEWTQFDSPHNYHRDSREAVYRFFGQRMLGEPDPSRLAERAARPEQLSSLLYLWGRTLPPGALDLEHLVRQRIAEAESDTLALSVGDAASLDRAQVAFRERLNLALLADVPEPGRIETKRLAGNDILIGRSGIGDRVPATLWNTQSTEGVPVLLVHPDGRVAAGRSDVGTALIERGVPVLAIDAFQTGQAIEARNIAGAGRNAERYYHVFNRSDDANRVQDILTAAAFLRGRAANARVHVVGLGRAGLWAMLAAALDGEFRGVAAALDRFDPTADSDYLDRLFIPGIRRAGDFRAAATLLADTDLLLHGVHQGFPASWYRAAFEAAGRPDRLAIRADKVPAEAVVDWLER